MFALRLNAANPPGWTRPFPPFHIAGNLYYVGSEDLAAYLITTPQGNILINSNLESSPALIKESIEKLGFHFSDTKILLISHGHFDHCAGSAQIVKETGAKYYVMDADVPVVQAGGHNDFHYANNKDLWFPAQHVDRALHDGETVSLGGTVLTAHKTAGHTKGTTTWTLDETEGGKTLHVVIVGSPNVNPGYKLVGNTAYPQIADDYRHEFQVLESAALRHLPRRARRLLRPHRKSTPAGSPATTTHSSIPMATSATSPIASRRSRPSCSASPPAIDRACSSRARRARNPRRAPAFNADTA